MNYKKKIFVLFLVSLLLIIPGCSNNTNGTDDKTKNENFRVTKVTVTGKLDEFAYALDDWANKGNQTDYGLWGTSCVWELHYDESGNLTSKSWTDEEGNSGGYKYTYDDKGNELTSVFYCNDQNIKTEQNEYYDDGTISLKEIHYHLNGAKDRYTYDEHGNIVKYESTGSMSDSYPYELEISDEYQTVEVYENTYDDAGNLLSTTRSYPNGNGVTAEDIYTYNDDGKEIMHESISAGETQSTYETEYNDKGQILSGTQTNYNGDMMWHEYSYDENDNVVSIEYYNYDGDVNRTVTREYYPDNTIKSEIDEYTNGGTCRMKDYDENGNLIRYSVTVGSQTRDEGYNVYLEYEKI